MKKTNIVFSFRHFFSLSFTVHSLSWHRCCCWYIQIFSHKITPQHLSTHTDIKKFTKPFIFHSLIQFTINQFSFLALISFSLSPSSLHSSHSLSPSPDNQRDASFLRAHQIWSSSFWFLLSGQEDVDSIFLPMSSSSSWPLTSAMVAVGRGKPFFTFCVRFLWWHVLACQNGFNLLHTFGGVVGLRQGFAKPFCSLKQMSIYILLHSSVDESYLMNCFLIILKRIVSFSFTMWGLVLNFK